MDKAISQYQKALSIEPKNDFALYNQAIVKSKQGNYESAIKDLEAAIKISPGYFHYYRFLAVQYEKLGMHDKAIEKYKETIKFQPEDFISLYNLALIYFDKGNFSLALQNCSNALLYYNETGRIKPTFVDDLRYVHDPLVIDKSYIYKICAETKTNMGNLSGAISDYSAAIEIEYKHTKEDKPDSIYFDDQTLMMLERRIQGRRIRLAGNALLSDMLFKRGILKRQMNDLDGALADFTEVWRINPSNPEISNSLGNTYLDKKEYDKAIAYYNYAIRLDDNIGMIYLNRGKTKMAMGDHQEALKDLAKVRSLSNDLYTVAEFLLC